MDCILPSFDENYDKILHSLMASSSTDRQTAEKLYRHLWAYAHGIACLCAKKLSIFTAESRNMLSEAFLSPLKNMEAMYE